MDSAAKVRIFGAAQKKINPGKRGGPERKRNERTHKKGEEVETAVRQMNPQSSLTKGKRGI